MEKYDLKEFNFQEYLENKIESITGEVSLEMVESIINDKKDHLQNYIDRVEKTYKKVNDYLAHATMFEEQGDENKATHQRGKYEKELKSLNELRKKESHFDEIQEALKYFLSKREALLAEKV